MKPVLFLQSEEQDPYKIYHEMLSDHPIYYDERNKLWAVYSYEFCKELLGNPSAHIPSLNTTGFDDYSLAITGKLPRFQNPPYHAVARQIAMAVYQYRKPAPVATILAGLLQQKSNGKEIDWIKMVAKRLPVLCILHRFDFTPADSLFIADRVGRLVTFTLPIKTEEHVNGINTVSKEIYNKVEWHINHSRPLNMFIDRLTADVSLTREEVMGFVIANLIGLLTQSYDACRGLLSTALYHLISPTNSHTTIYRRFTANKKELSDFVLEVLRYDPPVQHTRRILSKNCRFGTTTQHKGEQVLIILAAANRDEKQFAKANTFSMERSNNTDTSPLAPDLMPV
ncbi:cytochrome P450 [Flavitalea flava]